VKQTAVSKRGQQKRRKHYNDVIGQAKNRLCKTGQDLADKWPTLASIATPGHCQDRADRPAPLQ